MVLPLWLARIIRAGVEEEEELPRPRRVSNPKPKPKPYGPDGRCCAECSFWIRVKNRGGGDCQAFPPVFDNTWPQTNPWDWCGHWTPVEEDDPKEPEDIPELEEQDNVVAIGKKRAA